MEPSRALPDDLQPIAMGHHAVERRRQVWWLRPERQALSHTKGKTKRQHGTKREKSARPNEASRHLLSPPHAMQEDLNGCSGHPVKRHKKKYSSDLRIKRDSASADCLVNGERKRL